MNIAQNVCFFAKDIFQLPQNILYRLKLIYFATFVVEKKRKKKKKKKKRKQEKTCVSVQSDRRLSCSLLVMTLFIYSGLHVLVQ